MRKEHIYYVYFMISSSRRALYLGMTGKFRDRVWQHSHAFEGFSSKYNCTRWCISKSSMTFAVRSPRETVEALEPRQKDALIEKFNPTWRDLAEDWFKPETQGPRLPSARSQLRGSPTPQRTVARNDRS